MKKIKNEELLDAIKESLENVGIVSYGVMYNVNMPLRFLSIKETANKEFDTITTILHGGYPVAALIWKNGELRKLRLIRHFTDGINGRTHLVFLTMLCRQLNLEWIPKDRPYDASEFQIGNILEFTNPEISK